MRIRSILIPTLALLGGGGAIQAEDHFQIHGFVSQGYFITTNNDFLSRQSEGSGTFDQTEAGLNVMATPLDRLRVGIQVTASDMGEYGDMRPTIDWAFGEYNVPEIVPGLSLQVTGGRFKAEYGFYNEYRDLDMTRTPVFLPFAVYDPRFRDAFISLNGIQLKAGLDLKAAGTLDLSVRFGNPTWDADTGSLGTYFSLLGFAPTDISSEHAYGAALTWNTPLDGLRARVSYLSCKDLKFEAGLPGGTGTASFLLPDYNSAVFGLEWQVGDLTFVGEAKQTYYRSYDTYNVGITIVDEEFMRENGAYLSAAWRFHPQVEAVVSGQWAMNDLDTDAPPGGTAQARRRHRSINAALCWNVMDHWLIKAEAMIADGTLLISSGEQGGSNNDLRDNWTLFSIKTTFDF